MLYYAFLSCLLGSALLFLLTHFILFLELLAYLFVLIGKIQANIRKVRVASRKAKCAHISRNKIGKNMTLFEQIDMISR